MSRPSVIPLLPVPRPLYADTPLSSENARIIRLYLGRVSFKIRSIACSPAYKSAFAAAAKMIDEAKPD